MSTLEDLYGHQAWADAEHWRALEGYPPALADKEIRDRLHHIHLVQRFFLWAVGGQEEMPARTTTDDFADPAALKAWARSYHEAASAFLASLPAARRREPVPIPWFKDPPLQLPVEEAMLQAAMHSHYHRGQNATRLRSLGGVPPLTDLIVWYWRGRPAPAWER